MRIYTRTGSASLDAGLLGLLLAALDAEPDDVYLISPWLRDVELPIGDQGHFVSVLGGQRETVRLSDLLLRLQRSHDIHVLTKPPDELVPLERVRRIGELLDDREALVTDTEARDYESVERAAVALGEEIAVIAKQVTLHAEMIALLGTLSTQGIDVRVLPKLHAKLLWTPAGAMLGSANFTHAGIGRNEELVVEVSDAGHLADLRAAAAEFGARAVALTAISLQSVLASAPLTDAGLRRLGERIKAEPTLSELSRLLDLLGDLNNATEGPAALGRTLSSPLGH